MRTDAPVGCGGEVKELCEFVNVPCPAPRPGHVVCEVVNVVSLPVVRAEESLYMTPRGLDGVTVSPSTLINKASAVIDGAVRVTLHAEIPVRYPPVTDDRGTGFDPCIYNDLQIVSGSVRNGNEKRLPVLALDTAKNPLPLNRVASMIYAATELAVVDLDSLVRAADLLRAAFPVHQHCLSADLAPVRCRNGTEAMLSLD